jgi:hypothetical protein
MNRLFVAMVVCAMAFAINGYGQCANDLADKELCMYTLTPAQAASFSVTDNAVSAFWTTGWAGRDYVQLIPPDNCYPGSCNFVGGATDAMMTVKAGCTTQGLYLYVAIQDNIWVDRASASDIGADAVDLFFDDSSSAFIGTCTDCRIGLYGNFLTYTTAQCQIWMGGTVAPTGLYYQYYDNSLWSWGAHPVTWAEAAAQYNLHVEVVTVDATHKVQEWFIPWTNFGNGGFPVGTAIAGKRVGFSGGYNDKDGDNAVEDKLRFTGKDPWSTVITDAWGDMLIPSDVGPVEAYSTGVIKSTNARGVSASRVVATEYYSLSGSRIAPESLQQLPANSVCVKVSRLADGRRVSEVSKLVK